MTRRAFGGQVRVVGENLITLAFPGLDSPVIVELGELSPGGLLNIQCIAAQELDWSTGHLADVLLRESAELSIGGFVRVADTLMVQTTVFARGIDAQQLASAIHAIASIALEIQPLLLAAGALSASPT